MSTSIHRNRAPAWTRFRPMPWALSLAFGLPSVSASTDAVPQTAPAVRPEVEAVLKVLPKVEPKDLLQMLRSPATPQSLMGDDGIPYGKRPQALDAQSFPLPAARFESGVGAPIGFSSLSVDSHGLSVLPAGGGVTLIPEPLPIAALSVVSLQLALWMVARRRRQQEVESVEPQTRG